MRVCLDPLADFKTRIQSLHHHIEQDKVRTLLLSYFDTLLSVLCSQRGEPIAFQERFGGEKEIGVVIDIKIFWIPFFP
jgi:hypothetical protein